MANIVTHVTSIFKKYIQRGKMSILFYCSGEGYNEPIKISCLHEKINVADRC